MLKRLLASVVLALGLMGTTPTLAIPIVGGQIYSTGGDVLVTVLESTAGFTSELWLFEPGTGFFIALNHEEGTTVNLGYYAAGIELVFGIYVRDTKMTYYTGDASRNADNVAHAAVEGGAGFAIVGFEDMFGGGDFDFDDNVFEFVGVAPIAAIPEPGTLALLGAAMAGWALRRRI